MAETTKPVVATVPSVETLRKHLDTEAAKALELAGSPLINPFMWVAKNIRPLKDELSTVSTPTKEQADKVLAVKFVAPTPPKE